MSSKPKYAVRPVVPSTLKNFDSGARLGSTWYTAVPSLTAYSCTPKVPTTDAPAGNDALRDSITSPTAAARMTWPISTGRT